jgi:hypothetical protein
MYPGYPQYPAQPRKPLDIAKIVFVGAWVVLGLYAVRFFYALTQDRDDPFGYEDFADEVLTLSPGDEYLALAVFPAPGADVASLTLHAGAFGEFPDVPIR